MNRKTMALSLATLAGTAGAQVQPAPSAAEAPPRAALTLTTTDRMVGGELLLLLGSSTRLSNLESGSHYRITLSTDGKVRGTTAADAAAGRSLWIHATLDAPALLELYADEIDDNWRLASGAAILGLGQMGMSTREAAKLMQAIRRAPQQVASLELSLSSDPREKLRDLEISLALKPVPGTWLGKFLATLKPDPRGAPVLAVTDPLISLAAAIDPTGLDRLLEPLPEILSVLSSRNRKDRAEHAAVFKALFHQLDGACAAAGDPFGGGLRWVGAVRKPDAMADLLHSEKYAKILRLTESFSSGTEVEFEPGKLTYREVRVAKTTVIRDNDSPFAPAGDEISYSAIAGAFLVTTTGLSTDRVQALIDTALDQKMIRRPLPGGVLAVAEIKLLDLLDKFVPFDNPLAGKIGAPKHIRITLKSEQPSLKLSVEFK